MNKLIAAIALAITSFAASAVTWKGVDVGDAKYIYGGHKTAMILSEVKSGCYIGKRSLGTVKVFFFMSSGHVKIGCAADDNGKPVIVFPTLDDEPEGDWLKLPFPDGFRKFESL